MLYLKIIIIIILLEIEYEKGRLEGQSRRTFKLFIWVGKIQRNI